MTKRAASFDYSFKHTEERLAERYDLKITREDYMNMNTMCDQGKYTMIAHEKSDKQYVVSLIFKTRLITVVYDYVNERIKTVLPPKE